MPGEEGRFSEPRGQAQRYSLPLVSSLAPRACVTPLFRQSRQSQGHAPRDSVASIVFSGHCEDKPNTRFHPDDPVGLVRETPPGPIPQPLLWTVP